MTTEHERPTGWTPATPAIGIDQLGLQEPPHIAGDDGRRHWHHSRIVRVWVQRDGAEWRAFAELDTNGERFVCRAPLTFLVWTDALAFAADNWSAGIE